MDIVTPQYTREQADAVYAACMVLSENDAMKPKDRKALQAAAQTTREAIAESVANG
jgi:hypothetical protein